MPVICLISMFEPLINNKFNKYYNLNRIIIFMFGFFVIFFSEVIVKYSGVGFNNDFVIITIPIVLFLTLYLFLLKKIN